MFMSTMLCRYSKGTIHLTARRHLYSLISSLEADCRLSKRVACLAAHMELGQSLKWLLKAVPKLPPQAACPVVRLHQQSPRVSRSSWAGAPAQVSTFTLFPFPSMMDSYEALMLTCEMMTPLQSPAWVNERAGNQLSQVGWFHQH